MTLQPMSTAPRDGSELLLTILPEERAGVTRLLAKWNDQLLCWESDAGFHQSDAFSGWLDLEAMALDSERLDWLDANGVAHLDWCVELHRDKPIRAAIDKEMVPATPTRAERHAVKRAEIERIT